MRREYSVMAEALALSTILPAICMCFIFIDVPQADVVFISACCIGCLPSLSCPSTGMSAGLWGALHLHAGDIPCEAPLEQDVRVGRLVVTVQLPAHEVFSESLRTSGVLSGMAGSFAGFPA